MHTLRIVADALKPSVALSTVAVVGIVDVGVFASLAAVWAFMWFADAHLLFLAFFGFKSAYACSINQVQARRPFSMSLKYGAEKFRRFANERSDTPAAIRVFLSDSGTTFQRVPLPPHSLHSTSICSITVDVMAYVSQLCQ